MTAPPADGSSPPDIPLLDGRYAIGEAIGRGRSTVHRAEDRRLRRQVAIKEVRLAEGQEGAERARLRALREAQAAARLDNPGVVTVYDVVEEGGSIWLVMELVDAPSLAQLVADDGPLDHGRAARIGLGVLGALEAAHAVGVVHRDVKPANVLVGRDDRTKLADFGVATIRDESRVTATGTIVGSPSYMAPEQAMAADVGPFTDLWALGATLYYAVEGKPPFAGDSPLATASAVVHGEPRPPQSRGPLIGLLQRLLDKDPQRRPGARQVRATLVAAATTGPSRGARAGRDRGGSSDRDRARGAGGPATPFGRRDPTLIARPSPVRDTRQVIIPPAGQSPAPAPPSTEDAPSAGEAEAAAGDLASAPAGASTPAGGTEAVGDGGDAIPPTRAEQAVDDAEDEGAPAAASSAESEVAEAEPASPSSGAGDAEQSGEEEKSPAPAPSPVSLAGPSRVGDRVFARRSPAVVVAAVVAVVALIVIAAWAAAGDGDGDSGSETDGGGRDASSTTTAADEEASQTTATTAASTTTTTAADGGVPRGWTRYRGPNGVYTIAHPAGWQVQPADGPRVRIRDPETGSYLLIDWTDEPRPDPVADWRSQAPGFARRHEGYQEIRIEPFDYRTYNAAVWEFRYRDQGVDLHVANLGFVAGNRGYALYFQTHEDRWDDSQGTFDRFRESFRPG